MLIIIGTTFAVGCSANRLTLTPVYQLNDDPNNTQEMSFAATRDLRTDTKITNNVVTTAEPGLFGLTPPSTPKKWISASYR